MADEKEPIVKNGVALDLSRILRTLDGKPFRFVENTEEEKGEKRNMTLRDYLRMAFTRVSKTDDAITLWSLGSKLATSNGEPFVLADANLKFVRNIVEHDAIRAILDNGQEVIEPISPVIRGQVLAMLDGKS